MSTIFTKIIRGEVPAKKVYQDGLVTAFLDIDQTAPGHLLIVPDMEVDKFYDLPEADFARLMRVSQVLARKLEDVSGRRTGLKIIGTDVPHVHIHLLPLGFEGNNLTGKGLDEVQELLKVSEEIK